MQDWQVKLQLEAMAHMVRVEGMKAENSVRESKGHSLAYKEEDFSYMAEEIDCLAQRLLD